MFEILSGIKATSDPSLVIIIKFIFIKQIQGGNTFWKTKFSKYDILPQTRQSKQIFAYYSNLFTIYADKFITRIYFEICGLIYKTQQYNNFLLFLQRPFTGRYLKTLHMKNRLFSTDQPKGLVRQNSEAFLDKDSFKIKEMRQMREMKSVNKQFQTKKKHFFFQEGQKTVGDYKFDARKQIGSGYSSKVYKAVSLKNNLPFAIKAIQYKNFKPSHCQMLENQIRILKKMAHPNVLKYQNVSRTSSHLYIVTEFCQKGDLLTHMTRKGVLQQKQALQIFADILKGTQYLIKFGVIHRDIKPGNILFDGEAWKIADFGFAIQAKQQVKTKNNVGTPLYMPLQSLQTNMYSPQSDIFSVGVVLYELLVGITPWECREQQQLVQKLKNIAFKIPQKSKISSQVKQLLKKMCQPLKQNRMTRREFLLLDPINFKNLQSSTNLFIKDSILESNKGIYPNDIVPSTIRRKVSSKNLNNEFRPQQLKEKNTQKHRNQLNMFANGKMKRSSQNVKIRSNQSIQQLNKIKSAQNLFSSQLHKIPNDDEFPQGKNGIYSKDRSQKINRKIVFSLLNFCRFMYYLMRNAQYLQLNELNRQKVKIILLKHSICILKQLTDKETNCFNLQNYQAYIQTPNYLRLHASFQEYLTKYQKQYESITKKFDGSVTKEINQKMSQFQSDEGNCLNLKFYHKLLAFISPILRQNNHNLASQIMNSKKKMTDETKYKIEGIKSFLKYYRLVEMLSKQNLNYEYFEQNSLIQVWGYYGIIHESQERYEVHLKRIRNMFKAILNSEKSLPKNCLQSKLTAY